MENQPIPDQPHFMLKEIYQQPDVVRECLEVYGDWGSGCDSSLVTGHSSSVEDIPPHPLGGHGHPPRPPKGTRTIQNRSTEAHERPKSKIQNLLDAYQDLQQIHILACGTSRHAGLVGQYWLEQLAGIPTRVRSAAGYQEAPWPMLPNTLTIAVTQSGETADTLAAVRLEQSRYEVGAINGSAWLGMTNQPGSTLTQDIQSVLLTLAGQEVGVAATKTFTAQLAVFLSLASGLADRRQASSRQDEFQSLKLVEQVPRFMQQVLELEESVFDLAQKLVVAEHCIVLGQGINWPIALEGALKLKETTYLHAEGYAGGEFLHGPIALLDASVPVIAIAPNSPGVEVMLTTVAKVKTHGSLAIGLVTADLADETASLFDHRILLPAIDYRLSPLLTVLPLQLLAYYIAVLRGLNVDRPRNITKTLT